MNFAATSAVAICWINFAIVTGALVLIGSTTSNIAMINIAMTAVDGSGRAWQEPVQLRPLGLNGNPEQFVAALKASLPLVNMLRVQFNEFSFNPDGSMDAQMERFLVAAAAQGYQLDIVYAQGAAQNIGRGTTDWPSLTNAEAYAALTANYSDVAGGWTKMMNWMDAHSTVESAVYGWELMNESAGYKHSIRYNGNDASYDKADFVKLYADHAIALADLISARADGKILVGGWGYNGDFLTLGATQIGTGTALDYLRAGVGADLVWSAHLYPGWMGTKLPQTHAELWAKLDAIYAPVAGDDVLITETNAHGTVDDPAGGLDEIDLAVATYEWFAQNGIGIGWFPGAQTGSSHLVSIEGNGNLVYRHQHSMAHAMDAFSLGRAPVESDLGQSVVAQLVTVGLRNQTYQINDGEALFDTQTKAGFAFGYAGNDTLRGSDPANDFLYGGSGKDVAYGAAGDDFLFGQYGDDGLYGGIDRDALYGGDGNDRLDGGAGRDFLVGGIGNDIFYVSQSNDTVVELTGGGVDTVYSTAAVFSLDGGTLAAKAHAENLRFIGTGDFTGTGNALANRLTGAAGNDALFGLGGDDILYGMAGGDRLSGGAGKDYLTGGTGADVFVFAKTNGMDRIQDFQDNVDHIELSGFAGMTTAAQALGFAVQSGANVVFSFGAQDYLTVNNTTKAALADDLVIL